MDLNAKLLYYWINKHFSKVEYIPGERPGNNVKGPMFWGRADRMMGHLVVLTDSEKLHNVHLYPSIFLTVGIHLDELKNNRNEIICIGDDISVEKVFNTLLTIFDRFSEWSDSLQRAISEFLSYDAIIRSCDSMVDDPIALVDSEFHYIGYSKRLAYETGFESKYVDSHNYVSTEVINALTSEPDFKDLENIPDVFQYVCVENLLHKNIYYKDKYVGRLSIFYRNSPVINEYYEQILMIVAERIELLYSKLGTFWHRKAADSRLKMILKDCLDGITINTSELPAMLENTLRYSQGDYLVLVQFKSHFTEDKGKFTGVLETHLEDMFCCSICFRYSDQFFLLLNKTGYEKVTSASFNQALAVFLRESLLLAALSRPFNDIFRLPVAKKQTDIAMEMGEQSHPMYWYFKFDDYAFQYLLCYGNRGFLPEDIGAPEVLRLIEYDKANGTCLCETLKVYFEEQYNAVAASGRLCVARSTFLKRLDRINTLTGSTLEDYNKRLYFALTLSMLETTGS